jgi:hypothetical protein
MLQYEGTAYEPASSRRRVLLRLNMHWICAIVQAGVGDAGKEEDVHDETKLDVGVSLVLYLTSLTDVRKDGAR